MLTLVDLVERMPVRRRRRSALTPRISSIVWGMQDIRQSEPTYTRGTIVLGDQVYESRNTVCIFHVPIDNLDSVVETTEGSNSASLS